jgi:Ni,Fe-hydrogenase III large subunit
MARTEVRMAEIRTSVRLIVDVLEGTGSDLSSPPAAPLKLPPHSIGVGWVESPEGEWIAVLETGATGELVNARVRPASIPNFASFQRACEGWVLTDFAFIEHSFGLSIAGRDR